jgi:GntR family histidine utilization transcriptional repressor
MPKYQEIQQALLGRITSGDWPPGAPIPHEAALAEEFGVTRPTIGRALRGLVEGGLIERRRRAGSRVAIRQGDEAVLRIPVVRDEIEARGGRYAYLLLGRRIAVPPPPVRAALALPAGARALQLRCLHFEDGRPFQLEDRWINLRVLPEATEQDFAAGSANEWLVRQVPYTQAEHVLRAAAAAPAEAEALQLDPGSPVFVVERTTWVGADAITHVRLLHPGDAFRITARDARRPDRPAPSAVAARPG